MRAACLAASALFAAPVFAPVSAHAEAWSRSYVVDWLEPAFFHDGPQNDAIAPGSDCPAGTAIRPTYERMLKTPWRDEAAVKFYADAENNADLKRVLRFRGPNYEDVWAHPTLAPDLGGLPPVSGNIGYGFDLDGKVKPTDFATPEGAKGVDNNYYRAAGCWVSYRGEPYRSQRGVGINGYMRDGLYTIVIVMSGNKDPMNDDDAQLAFYQAKDKIPKDANGQVARDASFAIKPTIRTQSIVKVKIANGVVEARMPQEIRLHDEGWNAEIPDQLQMSQAQLRFRIREDGGFEGYFGGYRDWKILYKRQAVPGRDTESNQGIDLPSFYYQLERFADADPDPVTGKNRRISTAYRIRAVPAFVLTPDYKQVVTVPRVFDTDAPAQLAATDRSQGR
jgi:hypothetical protein